MLDEFDDAVEDFGIAREAGIEGALFNKGNALIMSGRFEEALLVYERATEQQDNDSSYLGNLKWAKYILDAIGGSNHEVKGPYISDDTGLKTIDVSFETAQRDRGIESLVFKGNVGNCGNVGIGGAPTTKGYPGMMGFVVRI